MDSRLVVLRPRRTLDASGCLYALEDGIVDAVAPQERLYQVAVEMAEKWAPKAKAGVYGVLREELYGEALAKFRSISYVHSKRTTYFEVRLELSSKICHS